MVAGLFLLVVFLNVVFWNSGLRFFAVTFVPVALISGWRPVQLTALGHGQLKSDAILRSQVIDLSHGFTVVETKLGKKILRLKADGHDLRIAGFGTLDEIDKWLKEAQVAV